MSGPILPDIPVTFIANVEEQYRAIVDLRSKLEEILQQTTDNGAPLNNIITTKLNVKQAHIDTISTQVLSAGVKTNVTGLSLTITPSSIKSTFLVFCRWNGEFSLEPEDNVFGLFRNGIPVGQPIEASNRNAGLAIVLIGYGGGINNVSTPETAIFNYLDKPNTELPVTYEMFVSTNVDKTMYTNRTVIDIDSAIYERLTSNIIVMEVGE